jgi:hypothetical protein
VLALGMTMPQLIDAKRFNPAETLWTADAPDGEELNEWIATEMKHGSHHGENPLSVAADAAAKSSEALREAGQPRHRSRRQTRIRPHPERHACHCGTDGFLRP